MTTFTSLKAKLQGRGFITYSSKQKLETMGCREYSFQVFSKSLKFMGTGGWVRATVSVDEEKRVINLTPEKGQQQQHSRSLRESPQHQPPSSPGGGANSIKQAGPPPSPGDVAVKPFSIQLADYRSPKLKSKKFPEGQYAVEIRSKIPIPIGARVFLFHSQDRPEFDRFWEALRKTFASAQRRQSVTCNGAAQPGPTAELPGPGAVPARAATGAAATAVNAVTDFEDVCGYAILSSAGHITYDGEAEFVYFNSSIYESFEANRCYAVVLDDYEDHNGSPNRLGVGKGDQVCLYVAFNQLELLAQNKTFICAWPFTQIINFGHSSSQQVRIEFGTRTCTGRAAIQFRFEEPAATETTDAAGGNGSGCADQKAAFVSQLAVCIRTPPSCQFCNRFCATAAAAAGAAAANGKQQRRDDDDAASEDDDDDEDDDDQEGEYDDVAASAVYATVQHGVAGDSGDQSQQPQSQPQLQPPLPPHPKRPAPMFQRSPPPTLPKPPLEQRRRSSPSFAAAAAAAVEAVAAAAGTGAATDAVNSSDSESETESDSSNSCVFGAKV